MSGVTQPSAGQKQNKKPTTVEYQKAVVIAKQVFELIGIHGVPPVPKMYELWFQYASKANPELVEKIDTEIKQADELSLYNLDQIHQQFVSPEHETFKMNEQISQDFESEMADVMALLQESAASTASYGDMLDATSKKIPDSQSPEQLKQIVQSLMQENQKMRAEVDKLGTGLEDAQTHVQTLNEKLNDALEQGKKDPMTLLSNRRHFDDMLVREVEVAKTEGSPLCLVMADIDHFKQVNDTFGHPVGDAVIKTLASVISRSVKGGDTAARYGGEEFAIILPNTKMDDALQLMEKVRKQFGESSLVIRGTGQKIGKVTASFGVSQMVAEEDPQALLSKADAALYEAKKTGRNKSVCYSETTETYLKSA
jgi:diguanylate cyclase